MVKEGVVLFSIFFAELLFLFLFSKKISNALLSLFYKISKNHDFSVFLLAFTFFPGTVIHELSHFFMSTLLLVHTGDIEFYPSRVGDSIKLGTVQIGQTDPVRRALIGLAPLVVGISIIILSLIFFPKINFWWGKLLFIYLIFEISNTMFSSKKDLEGLIGLSIAILVCAVVGYFALQYLNVSISLYSIFEFILNKQVVDFLYKSIFLLFIPLVLDLAVIFLFFIFKLIGR